MIIFRSNNMEDIEFARQHGVWQSNHFVKDGVAVGEPIAIQLTGTKDIFFMGLATTNMYEDASYAWPGDEKGFTKTLRFEPIDLIGQWPHKKI